MADKRRTLFSVIEVGEGVTRHYEVDWHPDLSEVLDEVSPNGELTDKIIDLAEGLLTDA